jgi:hypothetical protein
MTRDEVIALAREADIVVTGEAVWKLCALVTAAERADAERYRWLRDNNTRFSWNPSKYNQNIVSGFAAFGTGYVGFEFEEAIDKAMGKGE